MFRKKYRNVRRICRNRDRNKLATEKQLHISLIFFILSFYLLLAATVFSTAISLQSLKKIKIFIPINEKKIPNIH